ncbi:hypothetical protein LMG29542_07815 [Paraburkholderia humisilvae]|uniref:Uncharacterized protein n=1 Tax=Paraburkholderia humisilvae TaxID=627669 RepID=A0A6J5F6E9_9BURK|nr:hypothetical protein LMG29542_07815 [Paraburkholderia humisilvae]
MGYPMLTTCKIRDALLMHFDCGFGRREITGAGEFAAATNYLSITRAEESLHVGHSDLGTAVT